MYVIMTLKHYSYKLVLFVLVTLFISVASCKDENGYDPPTPFNLVIPSTLPQPNIPADNPLTVEGVTLGKMLFHEKALSKDGSMSCASCHQQEFSFTDPDAFSTGVRGELGGRNSMALLNMMWHKKGFFWDGRAPLLRDQALMPIQDELEMDETLENVVAKLEEKPEYKQQFGKAFGDESITTERMGLAMEQFGMTLISGNSKYDKVQLGEATFTDSEQRGHDLFFGEHSPSEPGKGADCFHCHGGALFTNGDFMNNGLDTDANFKDMGLYKVTENEADKAKFKVPSMRNVALTAPFMHDSRFETLEEVIKHYNEGAVTSSTLDPNMDAIVEEGLSLSEQDIADLIAFLHTLTDEDFINNTEFENPFE